MRQKDQIVAFTCPYLSWLGLDFEEIRLQLENIGIKAIKLEESNFPGVPLPCPLPNVLHDSLRYTLSVCTQNLVSEIEPSKLTEEWSARIHHSFLTHVLTLARFRPDLVVLVQGYEPVNAAVRAAAIELSIPLISIENTARSDRFVWDNVSGTTTPLNLSQNYYARFSKTISSSAIQEFRDSLRAVLNQAKSADHESPCGVNPSNFDRPYVLFLGQVFSDSSVIFGLMGWQSPIEILKFLVDWSDAHGYQTVVKLHPKEHLGSSPITNKPYNRLTYRKMLEDASLQEALVKNRSLVDSTNEFGTYELIEKASIVVTVNSQAGLEAAMLGKPVVTCGKAFYGNLGFTLDAPNSRIFSAVMNEAEKFVVPDSAVEFGYIFFEKFCKPKTTHSLVALITNQLRGFGA